MIKQPKQTSKQIRRFCAVVWLPDGFVDLVITSGNPGWSAVRYCKAATARDGIHRFWTKQILRLPEKNGKVYLN